MAKTKSEKEDSDISGLGLVLVSGLGFGLVSGLGLVLVSGLGFGLVSVLALVLASVSGLALVLASVSGNEAYTKTYVAGLIIGVVIGLFLFATHAILMPTAMSNVTTTIQPFNYTCQQIRGIVNGNITNSGTAQTYLALYRAKGC